MMYSFNGFTQKANRALNLAVEAAQDLGHTYIGTEHILLGLLEEGTGVASAALSGSGIAADAIEDLIKTKIGVGSRTALSPADFTPRSKRILQNAVIVAAKLGHNYVGTEHLLLALLEEQDSYALGFMQELGVKPNDLLQSLRDELSGGGTDDSEIFDLKAPLPAPRPSIRAGKAARKRSTSLASI